MHAEPPRYVDGLPRPGRTLVMGVLNVTPDSFSDGGRYLDPAAAVAHGRAQVAEGADLVDVGGESTRPGATRPSPDEELDRVLPVVRALAGDGVLVSVDTMRASVASAAVEAGAVLVNDVSGGLADEAMLSTVAGLDVAYVLMHWRAHSTQMQRFTETSTPSPASARTTGSTRSSSSSGEGRVAPGRVDSPPTSTRSAPSATSARPWSTATAGSR